MNNETGKENIMGAEWNTFIDSTAVRFTLIVAGLALWATALFGLLAA